MFSGLISATLVQIGGRTATTIPRLKDIASGPFWCFLQNFRPPGNSALHGCTDGPAGQKHGNICHKAVVYLSPAIAQFKSANLL